MQIQDNIHAEGTLSTNKTVESLNTTIFQDTGSANSIQIEIKGTVNLQNGQPLIPTYSQLTDIPIRIKKLGDSGNNSGMTLKIGNLTAIQCFRRSGDSMVSEMPNNVIRHGDVFTATFNGSVFLLSGDCFLMADVKSAISSDATKAPTSHASSTTAFGTGTSANYGHVKAATSLPTVNGVASVGSDNSEYARGNPLA